MAQRPKNIIEDIASDYLNIVLALRFDICTCQICKNQMLAYILSKLPAKYVTSEAETLRTIIEQTKVEHQGEIARLIIEAVKLVTDNPPHAARENKDENFKLLLDKIYQDRGLDFRHYRQELLKRRIALRIRANRLSLYSEYLRLLINKPEEYDQLFDVLTINVTEFFRDPVIWDSVKIICENLIERKRERQNHTIRVWSAGCASGAEAHSIAILFKELLKQDEKFSLKIIGTDIDRRSLEIARAGVYTKEALKNVSPEYLQTYLKPMGRNHLVTQEIKDSVVFKHSDLINSAHLENMDIVFCRNVFIYFSRSLQEMLVMKFYKALQKGGYLVMGKVETILGEAKQIFEEIDHDAKIYQKK